tara:strand:- start:39 stop:317 length:279 start_codon:yes stop_codon:yes gene_type:complete
VVLEVRVVAVEVQVEDHLKTQEITLLLEQLIRVGVAVRLVLMALVIHHPLRQEVLVLLSSRTLAHSNLAVEQSQLLVVTQSTLSQRLVCWER